MIAEFVQAIKGLDSFSDSLIGWPHRSSDPARRLLHPPLFSRRGRVVVGVLIMKECVRMREAGGPLKSE